jgi:glycosyltransferase involved in cell wall biosynthesis
MSEGEQIGSTDEGGVDESKKLAVTFVSTHLGRVRGGAEVNDLNLGEELASLGHDVVYVTIDGTSGSPSLDVSHISVSVPYLYDLSYDLPEPIGKVLRHLNEELFILAARRRARERLRESDLVLTTGRPVLTRLGDVTDGVLCHAVRGRVNPRYDSFLKRADGLVFWGGCEEEYDTSFLKSVPHSTLDPAVDTSLFRPTNIDRSALPYPTEDRTVVTFVGRLEPVKRVDRLVRAVGRLESAFDLSLVVVGDGSRREALEELSAETLTEAPYSFLGRVPQAEVPVHLNAADVFALASRLENHPISIKEALACGTFVVAPAIGRIPELVPTGCGWVFEENSTEGLTQALETVLRAEEFGTETPTDRATASGGWAVNARAVVSVYKHLN